MDDFRMTSHSHCVVRPGYLAEFTYPGDRLRADPSVSFHVAQRYVGPYSTAQTLLLVLATRYVAGEWFNLCISSQGAIGWLRSNELRCL